MLDENTIQRLVELQKQSYELLLWIQRSLKKGSLDFSVAHHAMSTSDAALEWIGRHYNSLPLEARPNQSDLREFSSLFASYLTTSFELVDNPGKIMISDCSCFCSYCCFLVSANHIKPKKIAKKARDESRALKSLYLNSLASDLGVKFSNEQLSEIELKPDLQQALSIGAYGNELVRRSKFASQGPGILVLWREFAWENNIKPKKNFELKTKTVLDSEKRIIEYLTGHC